MALISGTDAQKRERERVSVTFPARITRQLAESARTKGSLYFGTNTTTYIAMHVCERIVDSAEIFWREKEDDANKERRENAGELNTEHELGAEIC